MPVSDWFKLSERDLLRLRSLQLFGFKLVSGSAELIRASVDDVVKLGIALLFRLELELKTEVS